MNESWAKVIGPAQVGKTVLATLETVGQGERFLAVDEHDALCFCVECLPSPKDEEKDE